MEVTKVFRTFTPDFDFNTKSHTPSARGDYHEDSDWDLLVLLDKPRLEHEDFDKYSYPFVEMGWSIGEDIRPHTYTKEEWFNGPRSMFFYNVEEDKKVLL